MFFLGFFSITDLFERHTPPSCGHFAFGDLLLARHSMQASSALASFVGSPNSGEEFWGTAHFIRLRVGRKILLVEFKKRHMFVFLIFIVRFIIF